MIKIGFVPEDYRKFLNAIEKLRVGIKKEISDNLPYRGAVKYRENVFQAILTQKYAVADWAYNESYNTWKYSKTKHSGGYWQLSGDLARALSVKQESNGWFSGIQAGVMDGGNKSYGESHVSSIAGYARVMEYGGDFPTKQGTQHHKKRAVFKPVLAEFDNTWLKEGSNSLKKIASMWK